ncbi:hypothetical protein EVAR_17723_1 [Eumeta japonica]|uniref:Uncharacterized protein n=1 Tax=Eumeta variegata TaxID=151549 RepID=A0A4C1URV0_EUMVA|nr:hypothetical protein EVAR_17723_1 [Eumeta japonica]
MGRVHRYRIPSHEADNALVIPLRLLVYMGGGDRILFDGSHARLRLKNAMKKKYVCRTPPNEVIAPKDVAPSAHLPRGVLAMNPATWPACAQTGGQYSRPTDKYREPCR